jgi:nucleotide-binding universal stress UspA family protein
MFMRILVPLDGSALAEAALPAATALATHFGSTVLLLRIYTAPEAALSTAESEAHDEMLDHIRGHILDDCRAYVRDQTQSLIEAGIAAAPYVREGMGVAETIVAFVNEFECDTVVMSTHGRGGFSRLVFGSVADKVMRLTDVPVLLIRAAAGEA